MLSASEAALQPSPKRLIFFVLVITVQSLFWSDGEKFRPVLNPDEMCRRWHAAVTSFGHAARCARNPINL
jgi:hypothetical protein